MTVSVWIAAHAHDPDEIGFIPDMLSDDDPRPAREQLDANYQHGGGWRKFDGFKMMPDYSIKYPDDEPVPMLAYTVLHAASDKPEIVCVYRHSWVTILQEDGSYEIARMD